QLLDKLSDHFASHGMLLGSRPSIGDFGLYGPLFAHLYLDPASGELMKEKAPHVARWVERMRDAEAKPGEFLTDDEVPDTAIAILKDQLRDFLPVLVSTAAALTEWAKDKSSGEEVPRALGPHAFRIGEAEGNRMIFPFNLWMLQRPLDHLRALANEEIEAATSFLADIGASELVDLSFPRLARQNFKLVLA
ncbi:MAG: glutathione S-transferase C-terminal domain-containing protein, partial [Pseudomonadota bacterium]